LPAKIAPKAVNEDENKKKEKKTRKMKFCALDCKFAVEKFKLLPVF